MVVLHRIYTQANVHTLAVAVCHRGVIAGRRNRAAVRMVERLAMIRNAATSGRIRNSRAQSGRSRETRVMPTTSLGQTLTGSYSFVNTHSEPWREALLRLTLAADSNRSGRPLATGLGDWLTLVCE
jgi:hypothetical protein